VLCVCRGVGLSSIICVHPVMSFLIVLCHWIEWSRGQVEQAAGYLADCAAAVVPDMPSVGLIVAVCSLLYLAAKSL